MRTYLKRDLLKLLGVLILISLVLLSLIKLFPEQSRKVEKYIWLYWVTDKIFDYWKKMKKSVNSVKIENIWKWIEWSVNTKNVR